MILSKSRLLKFLTSPRTNREIHAQFRKYENVDEVIQELVLSQRIKPVTITRPAGVTVGHVIWPKKQTARERLDDGEPEENKSASTSWKMDQS